MMRTALSKPGVHSAAAYMVCDRIDTDIVAGTEAGMRAILVLSGVSTRETIVSYAYRPTRVDDEVGQIPIRELE